MYNHDNRIVVTLDAGGTNLVFGAMRGCGFIMDPVTIPSRADDLDLCMQSIVNGFKTVIDLLPEPPAAISFAFPGPADYKNGIVGGFLPNFPSFRNGVALGPFLEEKFGLPVFINNDGDLFAFGAGFGIGEVIGGKLNLGNNCCVETFCLPAPDDHGAMIEDFVAIRAITREYRRLAADAPADITPKDICAIADGTMPGDREAAMESFRLFGAAAGDAMATAVTLTDSIIVVGGGLTGAARHFMPALLESLRSSVRTINGEQVGRVQMSVFNLDDDEEFARFVKGEAREIEVYGTDKKVTYDPMKRTGITVSKLGASKAISIGAYTYALARIDSDD